VCYPGIAFHEATDSGRSTLAKKAGSLTATLLFLSFQTERKVVMPQVASQNDIVQVRLNWLLEGQQCKNVLHFLCASGGGDPDIDLHLIQVLLNCIVTTLLPGLSNSVTLQSITWKKVSPVLGQEYEDTPVAPAVGQNIKAALPTFCAAVISIRTGLGGRSHRGRIYIPGVVIADDNQDFMDPADDLWVALLNFCVCLATNFIPGDPPGANSWSLGVYSRKIGGAAFPYGLGGFSGGVTFSPDRALATQRSRKFGRGI